MEAIADLVALAIEADVAEGSAAEVAIDPIRKNALVGSTELTGTGHDPAAIDENLETERLAVFQREHFAGEFCRTIERDRRLSGKFLADAEGGETGNWRLETENFWRVGRFTNLNRKGSERRDRVDPAGAEQNKGGSSGFAEFQQIDRAKEVVFDQLARAGFSVHSGEHAGIRGGINHGVDGRNRLKVAGGADVSVEDVDAKRFEFGSIRLAAGSDEIIDPDDLQIGTMRQERLGQRAADETANSCYEDAHAIGDSIWKD